MKKIICLLVSILIILTTLCMITSATNNKITMYAENGNEYTVEFEDESVPADKQDIIAQHLIDSTETTQTYGLKCTLFGHTYKYTSASVIEHKVKTYNPRCKKQLYDVTYCEDCDYTEQTLVQTSYINCCPEE